MGGRAERFETTQWSLIAQLKADPSHSKDVLASVLERYWRPVYCYLRRKGYGNEQAKDLVQGFFHRVVLEKGVLRRADPARGRFRTFLLTLLDRYVGRVHRSETAKKRMPEKGFVRLGDPGAPGLDQLGPVEQATPEAAFHYAWASSLLDEVLAEVREGCRQFKQSVHWELFHARVVRPILHGEAPTPMPELCRLHNVSSPVKASNMIVTVKRRFRQVLRYHISRFVESQKDIEAEIGELTKILAGRGARPAHE